MAGELPVDLRTQRKGDGQDRWSTSKAEAAPSEASGSRSPEKGAPPPATLGHHHHHQASRQPDGAPEGSGSQPAGGAANPAAALEGERKSQTCLPPRKRRYPVEVDGPAEEARGPLAGKAPKRESSEGQTGTWGSHANGYCPPYSPVGYPRLPSLYYPGLPTSFLSSELPPLLHPVTPHPVLGIPSRYSLLCPIEAQLAWDIATATKQDEDGDTNLTFLSRCCSSDKEVSPLPAAPSSHAVREEAKVTRYLYWKACAQWVWPQDNRTGFRFIVSETFLQSHVALSGPLHIAVVQGNLPAVQRLVVLFHQGNQNLDTFNNLRQTPLHLAVITDQPALVKLLLSQGALPMVLDRNGQTALHLACEHSTLHCLQELLDGCPSLLDLEARNFEGLTPLHVAVGTCSREVVLTLLEHGADVDAVDIKSGRSPLLHAVENNNLAMVELLLQHGANVNAQSYGGNTALHAASGRGLLDMLRLLVRNGADGSLKNYHNDTPLMVAKNKKVIDILRGKASRPGPPYENVYEGLSPPSSNATSPGTRPAHAGLLCASPDSCPTTPSPSRTPKSIRVTQSPNSTNQKPESVIFTREPSAPLYGVKLEKSPTPPTSEKPEGFLGAPKYFLPIGDSIVETAFHPALYPFATSNHNQLPPHQFQLLPIGLNHPIVSLSAVTLASPIPSRSPGVDQPMDVAMTEQGKQWPPGNDSSPAGS